MVFSKKQEVTKENPVELPKGEVALDHKPNFTNVALSIYKNLDDNTWHLVKIQYNPSTGETGNFSAKSTGSNYRDEAEYQFKLAAVETVFNS